MATFQVPQFIDQKPKIVGPLTIAQFFYLAVAGGISFACFYIFDFFFWVLISSLFVGAAIALAFGKVNGQDMIIILKSALFFSLKPRVYTWQRTYKKVPMENEAIKKIEGIREKMNIGETIKKLTLNVTTGKLFSPKEFRKEQKKKGVYQSVTFLSTGETKLARRVDY